MKKIFFLMFFLFVFLSAAYSQTNEPRGRVFWRGMVDKKIELSIRLDKLTTKTIEGREYPDGVYSFTSPLPKENVTVETIKKVGRGTVRVMQQPSVDNDFTAIIEISDEKSGAKEYQLEILWR